jgi:hypothetical protein
MEHVRSLRLKVVTTNRGLGGRAIACVCSGLVAAWLAGCLPAADVATAGGAATAATETLPAVATVSATPITRPATVRPATVRPTQAPTRAPSPTGTPAPLVVETPSPAPDAFSIGGINLADGTAPLTMRYPRTWDGGDEVVVEGIDLLVSDGDGSSLAYFSNIGAWLGDHKIFVYPDTASGRPVLSIHDGTYAGVVLEAEPLRQLIEGSFRNPYPLETIHENLALLAGLRIVLEQRGVVAEFEVVEAVRMDADTTLAYRERPGELSTLLAPLPRADDSFLILICSTRQPNEPEEIFPARFVLAVQLVR